MTNLRLRHGRANGERSLSCAFATPALAADQLLSGAIASASGEKLGGVTVSAKLDGSTITTSVYTDEQGNYYFPPLPAGKYRVWAQALAFETDQERGRSLRVAQRPRAQADDRSRTALAAAARRNDGRGFARGDRRRCTHEEDLHQPMHRLPCPELRAAVPLR